MLGNRVVTLATRPARARGSSSNRVPHYLAVGTTATIVVGSGLVWAHHGTLEMKAERTEPLMDGKSRQTPLTFLWGRNTDLVVSPPSAAAAGATTAVEGRSSSPSDYVKRPTAPRSLASLVLRDLKLSRTYGVAIDANGDVLQWGLGFSATGAVERTLSGKDLVAVEATEEGKVYGIDRRGQVWVWSSSKLNQRAGGVLSEDRGQLERVGSSTRHSPNPYWWIGQGTIWGGGASGEAIECLKLGTDSVLSKGEKFVSLSSGQSHLLALTSSGRSFALPLCLAANNFGQLGVRKVSLLTPRHPGSAATGSLTVRLEPDERINEMGRDKVIPMPKNLDPLLLNVNTMPTKADPQPPSPTLHPLPPAYTAPTDERSEIVLHPSRDEHTRLEKSIGFCTVLHEIPSLKGVPVVELVAGRNHSLARLGGRAEGRVLGFGAGAYGQLGLGPSLSFPSIPTPTEIPFLRSPAYSASKPTSAKCVKIAAGGNLSYFVVETEKPGKTLGSPVTREIDLLASGQGQFGGIGNASWAHATHPLRVKTVSGLTEWNEATGKVEAIGIKDVQAGESHVAVVLDNAVTFADGSRFGRDVFTFGQNEFYQLGNGKRASLATPQHLPPLPYPSAAARGSAAITTAKAEETLSSGTTSPMPHKRLQ
ncbi:hypothetical protein JCM11491_001313, partial [Sporobolomyces phaffii]